MSSSPPSKPVFVIDWNRLRIERCKRSFAYFLDNFGWVLSDEGGDDASAGEAGQNWQRFRLWPSQWPVADAMQGKRLLAVLKARQVGLTWMADGLGDWLMNFHPIATVLLFSRRDDEAVKLLARLKGMHARLPEWMRQPVVKDSDHEFALANGSTAMAFPTTAGDSYTATLVVVDEADLVPDLRNLIGAVKPTIDAGGRMVLVSRADKSQPESLFKKIYRGGKAGTNAWMSLFLPWDARPGRDQSWYDAMAADVLANTGSLDDMHEHYPATDVQAMAPSTQDKRLAPAWLQAVYVEAAAIEPIPEGVPAVQGLRVYRLPQLGRRYVVGADPAEGNPGSDDSAAEVLDAGTGEEVATLAGKFQPAVFAAYVAALARWYNKAAAMILRNNHGHAVILWLADNATDVRLLLGKDERAGFVESTLGNVVLYDTCADQVRNGEVIVHDLATWHQLGNIEGATLEAPKSQHDDRADAFAVACVARKQAKPVRWGDSGTNGNGAGAKRNGVAGGAIDGMPAGVFG